MILNSQFSAGSTPENLQFKFSGSSGYVNINGDGYNLEVNSDYHKIPYSEKYDIECIWMPDDIAVYNNTAVTLDINEGTISPGDYYSIPIQNIYIY